MKLFQTTLKKSPGTPLDVQGAPFRFNSGPTSGSIQVKVDLCRRSGANLLIAGWRSMPIRFEIKCGDKPVRTREIELERPDVSTTLGLPSGTHSGFVLIAEAPKDESACILLTFTGEDGKIYESAPLRWESEGTLSAADQAVLGPALGLVSNQMPLGSPEWLRMVKQVRGAAAPCRTAQGFLESVAVCELTKDAVAVGWVVQTPGTQVWLEDQTGRVHSLEDAFRRFRQDVHDAVGNDFSHANRDAGFIVHLKGLRAGTPLRLMALAETGLHILAETTTTTLPLDPVAAARWLFGLWTSTPDMHRRIPLVDQPVLTPLLEHRQSTWDELPVVHRVIGTQPPAPLATIIVPLYGRIDFVEHQLIEFVKDQWLREHAELIYVVDDPRILEDFNAYSEALYRLYRLPFQWVWGTVNRGFSGANNLGVRYARGEHLVFLNSDAFPQQPGWVQQLVGALTDRPDLGAVGARLVFADGGIQHAGMEFRRVNELGIWVNHHPRTGLDPSLDEHRSLTELAAVTGACLAMRRADFARLGGWDTGYLIGDFEDSDLCLKIRADGMKIGYLPTVQLTHLERQSFKLLGHDDFRQKVVIYNAVRHQRRWTTLIEQSAPQD